MPNAIAHLLQGSGRLCNAGLPLPAPHLSSALPTAARGLDAAVCALLLLCLLLLLPSSSRVLFPAAWPASLQGSPCSRVLHRCWCGRWQQQCCPVVAGPQEGQRVQRRGQVAALIQDFTVELPLPGAAWASGHSLGNSEPKGAALGSAPAMQGEQSQDPGVLTASSCLTCAHSSAISMLEMPAGLGGDQGACQGSSLGFFSLPVSLTSLCLSSPMAQMWSRWLSTGSRATSTLWMTSTTGSLSATRTESLASRCWTWSCTTPKG